jgi:hypothetical protein
MDAVERRAELRVRPPGDVVLDFALWPADLHSPSRLPVSDLGRPTVCRQTGDRLTLADATAIGLGLALVAPPAACACLSAAPALFVYLKLRDFRPQAPNGVLSLFFHVLAARVETRPDGLGLGVRFLRQGRGSSFDRTLELLDVSRFGVPELAVWVDAVARGMTRSERTPGPGLDLDQLLDAPELGLAPTDTARNTS